ncbi:MAG: ferredoxin-type protein NapH [Clostridia bacterium]|jgi:ferredoxin-type protein NapH|nr:polyferredoxin [Clostridiales bacterium]MDK2986203.1 ferredoxin-type protein NapH [Clostridia bacterium]
MFTWKKIRRFVQIGILLLFLTPLVGNNMVLGSLNSSTIFEITLTDPLAFLEVLLASKTLILSILPGAILVLGIYLLLGKAYCSWVCPIGLLIELIDGIKEKLQGKKSISAGRQYYWSLPVILFLAAITGLPLFQTVSPIAIILRGLLFGIGIEFIILIFIILLELMGIKRGWCRIFCPLGAFYALAGRFSPLKIKVERDSCISCKKCVKSCNYCSKELEDLLSDSMEKLRSSLCTKCGECINSCPNNSLRFSFNNKRVNNRVAQKETAVSGKTGLSRRRLLEAGGAALASAALFPAVNAAKNSSPPLLRPPGAVPEPEFLARCIRCGKCIEVCSYKTLKCGDAMMGASLGTPYFAAREMPCYLCMECPDVCPSGALQPLKMEEVKIGIAQVDKERCYAYRGDICRSCWLNCPLIDEALYMEQFRYPVVDKDKCTGCGICEYVCVMDEPAIKIIKS